MAAWSSVPDSAACRASSATSVRSGAIRNTLVAKVFGVDVFITQTEGSYELRIDEIRAFNLEHRSRHLWLEEFGDNLCHFGDCRRSIVLSRCWSYRINGKQDRRAIRRTYDGNIIRCSVGPATGFVAHAPSFWNSFANHRSSGFIALQPIVELTARCFR